MNNRTCSFTGKSLSKESTYYNTDGTYMDVNTKQFLDIIPDLPINSLDFLIKEATASRNKKLTGWNKFLRFLRIKK